MKKRRDVLLSAALALVACAVPAAAAFPERPITMIVPFAPGGPADIIGRIIGERMTKALGGSIIIENVAGAGGTIGITRGTQSKPDGYTIILGNVGTHGAAPALYPSLKYDPTKDFAPIGRVAETPTLLVAKRDLPAKNLQEFITYVKANEDKLTEGHSGVGAASHTACTLLQSILGTKTARASYRATSLALNDLIAGQIDFMCDQIVSLVPHIQAGTIKALAIATPERAAVIKDVPTSKEGGLPEFQFSAWFGLFAPKDTSQELVGTLNRALVSALDDEVTRTRFFDLGSSIPALANRSPDSLQKLVESEVARLTPVLKASGAIPK